MQLLCARCAGYLRWGLQKEGGEGGGKVRLAQWRKWWWGLNSRRAGIMILSNHFFALFLLILLHFSKLPVCIHYLPSSPWFFHWNDKASSLNLITIRNEVCPECFCVQWHWQLASPLYSLNGTLRTSFTQRSWKRSTFFVWLSFFFFHLISKAFIRLETCDVYWSNNMSAYLK